jgi:hypothetical protein
MRRISVDERRVRLGRRQLLAAEARATDVVGAAAAMVVFHATDPASVYLQARARMVDVTPDAISQALYDDRTLVRMLGMRRTMFVAPTTAAPVIQAACTDAVAERERRRMTKLLADMGVDDADGWMRATFAATLAALAARGEALGTELSTDVPALRTKFSYGEGTNYATETTMTSQVLNHLSAQGLIVRGRPKGTWAGSQYRWAPAETWFPDGHEPLDRADAQAELVRRWLRAFGPGSEADVKWWTGLGLGEVRKAAAAVGALAVELEDGRPGLLLPDDADPVAAPDPWVALLPALDPTPMGWTERAWYLGEHRPTLFDRNGNIGPTVWADGRIVGGWAQYRSKQKGDPADGEIRFRLLEDVGAETEAAVAADVERLQAWIGPVRFTPRFRTPLERELTA